MKKVEKGKYKHFKGKEYEVLGVVRHSETLKDMVLYKALYDSEDFGPNALWVRPIDMFFDEKTKEDGTKVKRFELLESYED